jgi:hypothetical protein
MKYLEWNNVISEYFFNSENAGKEVHLYLTKSDIIQLGKKNSQEETDEEIWQDFLTKIKLGLPGSNSYSTIIDKAIHAYNQWTTPGLKSISGIPLDFPPYISYLVFLVLPLVDTQDNYNANNYYKRLSDFLDENEINQNLYNRLNRIDVLWSDLAEWANLTKNGELGFFRLLTFIQPNWIHVGKVFSQCIFPPKSLKKLPELFLSAGLIPGCNYPSSQIKQYLLKFGSSILHLPKSTIDAITKSDTNELGQSIIETARKEYTKWTGESHTVDEISSRTIRNDITSRIYLQFQLFSNTGRIEFSYRVKSVNEFPEDLTFDGREILEERGGYSKTISLPFKPTFQLKDNFNRWIAKFPDRNVRLFISAGSLQFSTDYWIETDSLSKVNWMYLLCKNSDKEKIYNWLKSQCSSFDDETDYENMPQGYSLFKFLNPKEGLHEIPELTIFHEKKIQLVSGLEFDFRTFTNDFIPEVEILNSEGTESVFLQYKNNSNSEKILLKKKNSINDRWLLPDDIILHADFNIRVENETFKDNETTYKIITSDNSAIYLDENKLPKRDSFGKVTNNEITEYSFGSNTIGVSLKKQESYKPLFNCINEDSTTEIFTPNYTHSEGNILLSFLSLKGKTTAKEFYSAFEFLHSKYFGGKAKNNNLNYSKIKKSSINFFDYLGYLDYEYETNTIVVNPPQLIFIPTNKGRRVLLIGGRDASLINAILKSAPKHNLQVEIKKQFQSNEDLLLPDAITIKSFGTSKENYGVRNIIEFARELKIKFTPDNLVQVGLLNFCSSIDDYEIDLFENKETILTYEDWAMYVFNVETLKLDKSSSEVFDKNFSLLEYRLRPWEFYQRLWVNKKCYEVDKNWGKYLALKYYNRNVILYDSKKEKVAIPVELPLPRLLAESIMLLSGLAPIHDYIEGKAYRIYENIPSIFIQNLFSKLKQKTNTEFNL